MPRYLRYLRIAFSATCLIACVLLIVLWVRSYWTAEGVTHIDSPKSFASIHSECGTLSYHYQLGFPTTGKLGWAFHKRIASYPYAGFRWEWYTHDPDKPLTWHYYKSSNGPLLEKSIYVYLPYWVLVLLTGISSTLFAIPWIRWRR